MAGKGSDRDITGCVVFFNLKFEREMWPLMCEPAASLALPHLAGGAEPQIICDHDSSSVATLSITNLRSFSDRRSKMTRGIPQITKPVQVPQQCRASPLRHPLFKPLYCTCAYLTFLKSKRQEEKREKSPLSA